mmetsp:Transcript_35124/g.75848  ORF Transcript_35124/g.75848 Transcript_35124/m.75848 type:complete len:326 (-) Transcript_35124:160-1137(-)
MLDVCVRVLLYNLLDAVTFAHKFHTFAFVQSASLNKVQQGIRLLFLLPRHGFLQLINHLSPRHLPHTPSQNLPIIRHDQRNPFLENLVPRLLRCSVQLSLHEFLPTLSDRLRHVRLRLVRRPRIPEPSPIRLRRAFRCIDPRLVRHHENVGHCEVHLVQLRSSQRVSDRPPGSRDQNHVLLRVFLHDAQRRYPRPTVLRNFDVDVQFFHELFPLAHRRCYFLVRLLSLHLRFDGGSEFGILVQIELGTYSEERHSAKVNSQVEIFRVHVNIVPQSVHGGRDSRECNESTNESAAGEGGIEEEAKTTEGGNGFNEEFVGDSAVDAR